MDTYPLNLYYVLDVPSTATQDEIRASYKKLAKKYHPDKNLNSGDTFKTISYAYEVLTDPEKCAIYREYGLEGLKKLSVSGIRRFQLRDCDISHNYEVTLEDLYVGKLATIIVNRNIICSKCKGSGKEPRIMLPELVYYYSVENSWLVRLIPCIPDMYWIGNQYFFHQGAGYFLRYTVSTPGSSGDRCTNCSGEKVCVEKKQLYFRIERGMKNNEEIIIHGQGHQAVGKEPGSVVVTLKEAPHKVFERIGDDLFVEKEITHAQALHGFSYNLKYSDGSVRTYNQPPGVCNTEPDHVLNIPNKGMFSRDGTERGYLCIRFRKKSSVPRYNPRSHSCSAFDTNSRRNHFSSAFPYYIPKVSR